MVLRRDLIIRTHFKLEAWAWLEKYDSGLAIHQMYLKTKISARALRLREEYEKQ